MPVTEPLFEALTISELISFSLSFSLSFYIYETKILNDNRDSREGVDDSSGNVGTDVVGACDGLSGWRGGVAVRSSGILAVELEVVELSLCGGEAGVALFGSC